MFERFMTGFMSGQEKEPWDPKAQDMLKMICKGVEGQKKRLGGDFAVAHVVFSRKSRDLCRKECPDIVFITLTMTEECQKKRLQKRHGDNKEMLDFLTKLFDELEPAGDDEENAYNIIISEDMSKEDVLNRVLEVIAKI